MRKISLSFESASLSFVAIIESSICFSFHKESRSEPIFFTIDIFSEYNVMTLISLKIIVYSYTITS